MENAETQTWVEFSLNCKYISQNEYEALLNMSEETGRLLSHMINYPEKYK